MDTSLWTSFSNKMNDPCGIKRFFRFVLVLFHFLVVLVISILAPLYDNIKDWILVIILLLSRNYAWGCLFALPIFYGYIGQFMIWRHEEVKCTTTPRKHWIWRIFPFYGIMRNISLLRKIFDVLRGKSKEDYTAEKDRVTSRLNPIELFNESLPQLLLLNCAVSGLIINANINKNQREIAMQKGYKTSVFGNITILFEDIYKSLVDELIGSYKESLDNKTLNLDNLSLVYDEDEIKPLADQLEVFSWMYDLAFIFSYIGLFFFMFDGPVPLLALGPKRKKDIFEQNFDTKRAWLQYVGEIVGGLGQMLNFIFGPFRQIVVFGLILGTFYVDENGEVVDDRYMFWLKILIYFTCFMLPAIVIQYIFFKCSMKCVYSDCCVNIWAKIPFIYSIPVFTGVFTSLKEVKHHQTRKNEDFGSPVLQVSAKARLFHQITRVITTTTILTIIWWTPNLKVLRVQHFAYMHIVNGYEFIFAVLIPVSIRLLCRCCCVSLFENFRPFLPRKYGIFDPDNDRTDFFLKIGIKKSKKLNSNSYILELYDCYIVMIAPFINNFRRSTTFIYDFKGL